MKCDTAIHDIFVKYDIFKKPVKFGISRCYAPLIL